MSWLSQFLLHSMVPNAGVSRAEAVQEDETDEIPSMAPRSGGRRGNQPSLPNPGRFEKVTQETQELELVERTAEHLDGVRFELTRQYSPQFVLSHSLALGQQPTEQDEDGGAGYTFMCQYGPKHNLMMVTRFGPEEMLFMTKIFYANFRNPLGSQLSITAQTANNPHKGVAEVLYVHKWLSSTFDLRLVQPAGVLCGIVGFAQSILQYQKVGVQMKTIAQGPALVTDLSFAWRGRFGMRRENVYGVNISTMERSKAYMAQFSYAHYLNMPPPIVPGLRRSTCKLLSTLDVFIDQSGSPKTMFKGGYQYTTQFANVKGFTCFPAQTLAIVLEAPLSLDKPDIKYSLSALLNYQKKEFKFGAGITWEKSGVNPNVKPFSFLDWSDALNEYSEGSTAFKYLDEDIAEEVSITSHRDWSAGGNIGMGVGGSGVNMPGYGGPANQGYAAPNPYAQTFPPRGGQ